MQETQRVTFDSENPEQDNSPQGFCLIQTDEVIKINGLNTKVVKFDKKKLMVELLSENVDELIAGKEVTIKSAKFVVVSAGHKFANLRAKAANTIYDQVVLDELNKKKIMKLRKGV